MFKPWEREVQWGFDNQHDVDDDEPMYSKEDIVSEEAGGEGGIRKRGGGLGAVFIGLWIGCSVVRWSSVGLVSTLA